MPEMAQEKAEILSLFVGPGPRVPLLTSPNSLWSLDSLLCSVSGTQMLANPGTSELLEKCQLVQPLQKTVWQYLLKLNAQMPYDLVIPLPGIHPIEMWIHVQKMSPAVSVASLFIRSSSWKLPKCTSSVGWKNKSWYPLPMDCYLAMRMNDLQTHTAI